MSTKEIVFVIVTVLFLGVLALLLLGGQFSYALFWLLGWMMGRMFDAACLGFWDE